MAIMLDCWGIRLGINDSQLDKLEEEAEYAAAKAELEELRHTAMEKIDTYKRRLAFHLLRSHL